MKVPIHLLSTDFDGTLHAEFENPPVPLDLQDLIADLQAKGLNWVINTGRDVSSLMESLGRAQMSIWPEYIVTVEREIHFRSGSEYKPCQEWNRGCSLAHEHLFARVRLDLPRLTEWVNSRFQATVYQDAYSPFCLIAGSTPEAEEIHAYLDNYCLQVPGLTVVRNDVYARFSHAEYNKGSALAEVAKRLGICCESIAAAGDHLNDLPMLSDKYAKWLIAPANAVPQVKDAVLRQGGFVSRECCGHGLREGLQEILRRASVGCSNRTESEPDLD